MHLRYVFSFITLALSGAVLAAPSPAEQNGLIDNVVLMNPSFTFSNDIASITIPSAAPGEKKAQRKVGQANAKAPIRAQEQKDASNTITAMLNQAKSQHFNVPDNMKVDVISNYHGSGSDPNAHFTFRFNDKACGGACTGHAYKSADKAGFLGKIFSDTTHQGLWGDVQK